jgi:tetratricopeptide (TPR) repeat protein
VFRLPLLLALVLYMGQVHSDQNDPALPALFDQLQQSTDGVETRELEARIWTHWLDAPTRSSTLLLTQVELALSEGKLDLALRLCNQLVDGTPEFAEGWNKRATIHYLLGDNDASVADIRETLLREPRHFGAISGLGLIFLRSGNREAALEAFEQVLAISPGSINAKNSVEQLRQQIGREI